MWSMIRSQSKKFRSLVSRVSHHTLLFVLLISWVMAATSCGITESGKNENENKFNFETGPSPATVKLRETTAGSDSPAAVQSHQTTGQSNNPAQTSTRPSKSSLAGASQTAPPNVPAGSQNQQEFSGRKVPLYLQTGDETQNEEPAVPLTLPQENPIRGVSGHRVERFFKTLSTNPVYYHYAVIPGEDVPEDEPITEVLVVLNGDRSYLRITTINSVIAVLSMGDGRFYQLDLLAGSYEELPDNTSFKNELSMEAYRSLEANAANFISTGKGEAIFYGRKVVFEEFTPDGSLYMRYYFVGDALVGHRSFQAGKILQTVKVEETSNRTNHDVFAIPEGFVNSATGETAPAPKTTQSQGTSRANQTTVP